MKRSGRAVVAVLAAATVVLPASPAVAAPRGRLITFGATTCAPNWRAPNPGLVHFRVRNDAARSATVYLFRSISEKVVVRLTGLAPHSATAVSVRLTPGSYTWACDLDGGTTHLSDNQVVPVHGPAGGAGPPVVPVTPDLLAPPLRAYRAYVRAAITRLRPQVAALVTDLDADDTAAAESDWLAAHSTWLSIGQDDGPYSAFGGLGARIDRTAAGLVHGTADPGFVGFHAVEFELWTTADLAAAAASARELDRAVATLAARDLATELPRTNAGLNGLALRCHEILEDALRDSLTGGDDYGSHSDLATVRADTGAIRELLGLLAPLIVPRRPHLVARARAALAHLDAAAAGAPVALAALPRERRERLDAAAGAALEILAPVPDLLQIGHS